MPLLCCALEPGLALGLVLELVPSLFSLTRSAVAKLLIFLPLWHVEEFHGRNADSWVGDS